jgi:hypothetical protein
MKMGKNKQIVAAPKPGFAKSRTGKAFRAERKPR